GRTRADAGGGRCGNGPVRRGCLAITFHRVTNRTSRRPSVRIPDANRLAFGRRLRAWYRRHARPLPWRETRDPYRVLVSELMLQQTQVDRVLPRYAGFLAQFPTLESVASASCAQVSDAWAGLGYYARARNLHALAQR